MSENKEIIVEMEDGQLRFTKSFLCSHSAYFEAMFAYDFRENICNHVKLKDITVPSLNAIVDFCNSGVIDFNATDVFSVLKASIRLQFDQAIKHCIAHLNDVLDDNNCLRILQFSHKYSLDCLLGTSLKLSLWLFEHIRKTEDFKKLKLDCLMMYLGNNNLYVESELNVFIAMDSWITFHTERLEFVDKLFRCLKFRKLSSEDLKFIRTTPYVLKNERILGLLTEVEAIKEEISDETEKQARILSVLNIFWPHASELNASARESLVKPAFVGVKFKSVCNGHKGSTDKGRNKATEPVLIYYNLEKNVLENGLSIPFTFEDCYSSEAYGYSLAVIGRYLYLLGGEHNLGHSQWNLSVQRYDFIKDTWENETRLPSPRRHQSVCVIGNDIYLVGGFGRYRIILDLVEKYDTVHRKWHNCAKLPTPGFRLPLCTYKNKLIVIGSKVHMYSPKTDSWSDIDLELPQVSFDNPVVHKDIIYLLETCHPIVWKIDLETNHVMQFCKLPSICRFASLFGDTIYLFAEDDSRHYESNVTIVMVHLSDPIRISTYSSECEGFKLSNNSSSCINYMSYDNSGTHLH